MSSIFIYAWEADEDDDGKTMPPKQIRHCHLILSEESMEFDARDLLALGIMDMMRRLIASPDLEEIEWYIAPMDSKKWERVQGDALKETPNLVASLFAPGKRLKGFVEPESGIHSGEVFADFIAGDRE